jgi:3'-phosphoadenosine 5'-phosphosulfate sulfotransferase (PAPS reductase)/FAD synthetase
MNPYRIDGPAVISFSGGRTSGYMLRHILDAHGGTLPGDVIALFANTGKEREETLRFVNDCSIQWSVPIAWLEYRVSPGGTGIGVESFEVVSFETASRNGEPFQQAIEHRGYLPNPRQRFCTELLKLRTMRRYCESLGWSEWTRVVGMRADEPRRVAKLTAKGHEKGDAVCPLYDMRVTEGNVDAWWKKQPFDLWIRQYEGNCDVCFLKHKSKRERIAHDRPQLFDWWVEREQWAAEQGSRSPYFRPHERDYEAVRAFVARQQRLPVIGADDEDIDDCACTD